MPMIWNGENDHKLFLWILHHIETKDIDIDGFAAFIGNGCTPKAIGVHISTLRNISKDIQARLSSRSASGFTAINREGSASMKNGRSGRPKKDAVSGSGEGLGVGEERQGQGGKKARGGVGGKRKRAVTEEEGHGDGDGDGDGGEGESEVKKVKVEGADEGAEGAEEGKLGSGEGEGESESHGVGGES